MGSISVAIELRDDFTNMLCRMAESVNFRIIDSDSLPSPLTVDVRIHPILPDPLIHQPAPVRVPVQWQSGGPEIFNSSVMERFRQIENYQGDGEDAGGSGGLMQKITGVISSDS